MEEWNKQISSHSQALWQADPNIRTATTAGDFSPLGKLTVQEVKAIGAYLDLPQNLVEKVPSDGLTSRTDEDNLGFTYQALDDYIRRGILPDDKTKERIDRLHKQNLFKLELMPSFKVNPDEYYK